MTLTQHERAIKLGLDVNEQMRQVIGRYIGTTDKPRGRLLAAYRNARRAIAGNTSSPNDVREILAGLRQATDAIIREALTTSAGNGWEAGRLNANIYALPPVPEFPPANNGLSAAGLAAVLAALDAQITTIQGMVNTGLADEALILGGPDRVGMLSPAQVQREGAHWVALVTIGLLITALGQSTSRDRGGPVYLKQAVAAIDERTTDCCLRVNGQTKPQDKPFVLTGTPRYADEMAGPPFHNWCRTATVIVRASDANDDVTREMRDAGQAEIKAREETLERQVISPADATSRRGG